MRFSAVIGGGLLAAMVLAGCEGESKASGEAAPTTAPTEQAAVAPVVAPAPSYAMEDGGAYGYEQALTEQDKAQGKAGNSLVMVSYAGENRGKHQIFLHDSGFTVFECGNPCEFFKVMVFTDGGEHVRTERMRASPEMIASLAMSDAQRGFMKRAGLGTSKSDVKWAWFTEEGIRFSKVTKEERHSSDEKGMAQ